jgi:hypothetical protein
LGSFETGSWYILTRLILPQTENIASTGSKSVYERLSIIDLGQES